LAAHLEREHQGQIEKAHGQLVADMADIDKPGHEGVRALFGHAPKPKPDRETWQTESRQPWDVSGRNQGAIKLDQRGLDKGDGTQQSRQRRALASEKLNQENR
jgi:hypothetical protein